MGEYVRREDTPDGEPHPVDPTGELHPVDPTEHRPLDPTPEEEANEREGKREEKPEEPAESVGGQ